jgi:hypothetical protein
MLPNLAKKKLCTVCNDESITPDFAVSQVKEKISSQLYPRQLFEKAKQLRNIIRIFATFLEQF